MQKEKHITSLIFDYCDKAKTKIAKRVYENVLNYDLLEIIQLDDRFYIQKTCSWNIIPNYAYDFVKRFYKKQGLKYLYE